MNNKILGNRGENIAAEYLQNKGYQILCRNYRCAIGEIDIIASQQNTVVFVEVKTRSSLRFGRPGEAVDYRKQHKIIRTAQWYCQGNNLRGKTCRFDVVEVLPGIAGQMSVRHLKGAFEA